MTERERSSLTFYTNRRPRTSLPPVEDDGAAESADPCHPAIHISVVSGSCHQQAALDARYKLTLD